MKICIFGDSIAWGANDDLELGWVSVLRKELEKKHKDIEVYNLSISGDTTRNLLKRFSNEANARNPDKVVFAIGINDSARIFNDNEVRIDEFKNNLLKLIEQARMIVSEIIFIGLTNVDERRTNPTQWENISYTNQEIKKYDSEIEQICKANRQKYVKLFGILDENDLDDGLHPNNAGHKKMMLKIKQAIFS